jgi:hypothetical protein
MRVHHHQKKTSLKAHVSALALVAALLPVAAYAQSAAAPSEGIAVDVLQALVAKGVLSKKDAKAILSRAEANAAARTAAAPAPAAPQPASEDVAPGVVRVPYVPENVTRAIEKKVRADVLAEADSNGWAKPDAVPAWTKHIKLFGDVRFRDEERLFDNGNGFAFVNIPAINAGSSPLDHTTQPVPVLNSTQDRNLLRLRARLGVQADINDQVKVVISLATGGDNGPVSTNQTLGGYFDKKSIWLDRAYIDWQPTQDVSVIFGRQDNPFRSTEIVWKQDDLALDGVSASYGYDVRPSLHAYATAGAFPLSYAPDDYPTAAPSDLKVGNGSDKWLFAVQAGADFKPTENWTTSFNAAYYYFLNAEGTPSPCIYTDAFCFTDITRPGFAQKGNTYIALRPDIGNSETGAMPEYYGLASQFHVLDLIAKADYRVRDDMHITFTADVAKNLGYNRLAMIAEAGGADQFANNNETCILNPGEALPPGAGCEDLDSLTNKRYGANAFMSGNMAWLARVQAGAPVIRERWDWNANIAYAYIQPDAVVDAFNDSDFRLGGTNSKGWILGGSLGVAHNTWLSAKWLSADVVYGPAFSVDVLQFDINTRF